MVAASADNTEGTESQEWLPLEFFAYGSPAPQGSKHPRAIYRKGNDGERVFTGKVTMTEMSSKLTPWRSDVKAAAEAAIGPHWTPYSCPVRIDLLFIFTRPKSHYGTGRNAHLLKPSAPPFPVIKTAQGDVDKLQRSTFDALTAAGVWEDDRLVVKVFAEKEYGARQGARVVIRPVILDRSGRNGSSG